MRYTVQVGGWFHRLATSIESSIPPGRQSTVEAQYIREIIMHAPSFRARKLDDHVQGCVYPSPFPAVFPTDARIADN